MRGTLANVRLKNRLAGGKEGGFTTHQPSGAPLTIFDAAERYRSEGVPLVILAGSSYGQGSSRDWAAKGPLLLGVRAVLAKSFERIHRGNLVGMGVMPIVFRPAEGASELGLTGQESYTISIPAGTPLLPKCDVLVRAEHPDGKVQTFTAKCRIDSPAELEYYESGGILPYALDRLAESG